MCTTRSAPVSWTDPSKVWRNTSARTALPPASSTRRPSRPNARTRPPKRLPRDQVSGRRRCCACSFWSHGAAGSSMLTRPRRHDTPVRHYSVPTLPAALTNPFSSSSLIIWTLPTVTVHIPGKQDVRYIAWLLLQSDRMSCSFSAGSPSLLSFSVLSL